MLHPIATAFLFGWFGCFLKFQLFRLAYSDAVATGEQGRYVGKEKIEFEKLSLLRGESFCEAVMDKIARVQTAIGVKKNPMNRK